MPNVHTSSELASNWRQLVAVWIVFFIIAGTTFMMPPVMLPALMEEFHTTEYGISWLPAIFLVFKGVTALPIGDLIDRFGVCPCIRAGSIIIFLASICYPLAESLWFLAVLHALFGLSYNLSGLAPVIIFANSWFESDLSSAIGILVVAFSMAGVIFPPLASVIIVNFQWRMAASICPVLTGLVVLPIVFFVLHDGPLINSTNAKRRSSHSQPWPFQSIGRQSCDDVDAEEDSVSDDRARHADSKKEKVGDTLELSFTQCLKRGAVWHLAFMSLYQLYIIIALLNTLILFLNTDAGLPLELCGQYSSLVFLSSIAGKLICGAFQDSQYASLSSVGSFLLMLVGTTLSLQFSPTGIQPTTSKAQLIIFTLVYGFGYGASFTIISSKPARMFGRMSEFGKLQSFLMIFQVFGGFCGTLLTGKLREITGSYTAPFGVFMFLWIPFRELRRFLFKNTLIMLYEFTWDDT